MARFLCDFNALDNQAKNLRELASEMKSGTDAYKNKISEDLAGWNSFAKAELFGVINNRTPQVEDMAQTIEDLGNFIIIETNKIKELEEKLGSFNI